MKRYTILGEAFGGLNYQLAVLDNCLCFRYWKDGEEIVLSGNEGKIEANKWYFVAVTYDGTCVKFYIDGELDKIFAIGDIDQNNSRLFMGSLDDTTEGMFNGKIDDVVVFNRALPDEEIISLYDSGIRSQ
jgi:hypothetical protein